MKLISLFICALLNKYTPSVNPKKDLIRIGPSQASFLSRRWLDHILNDYVKPNNHLFIHHEPIVKKINQLEGYIQENREANDYYLAWMPPSLYKNKDVIFIVVCQYNDGVVYVKHIIPSPHWTPQQIESIKLKKALEMMYEQIVLTSFYETDLRFKLAWSTWWLELNQ